MPSHREAAHTDNEEVPLVNPPAGYSNPLLDREQLEAAMQEDNVSVCSGQDPDAAVTDAAMKKGNKGQATSVKENLQKLKEQPVLKKKEEDDSQAWWLAPVVVVMFIFFDGAKILGERQSTHGTSIGLTYMQWSICVANMIVAFALTATFQGKEGIAIALDWQKLKGYILPSVFFASGQLFNLLQNQYIDSGTRKVFAQLRIPLTAFFARFVVGTAYSPLQWVMIISICVSVVQFSMMTSPNADAFAGEDMLMGLALSVLSNLSAVLGSLGGEKTMKEARKLPFYIQKFQFEVWTLTFAIVAGFVFAPLGAIAADYMSNGGFPPKIMEGKEFVKNWLTTYRGAQWTYNDALVKGVPFNPEYEVMNGEGQWMKAAAAMPNSFDVSGFTSTAEEVVSPQSFHGHSYNDANLAGLRDVISNLVDIKVKRGAVLDKVELAQYEDRDNFVDQGAFGGYGKIGQIAESHYRKLKGMPVLFDTSFYTKQPFARSIAYKSAAGLTETFVLYLGEEVNGQFKDLGLMRRDLPGKIEGIAMAKSEHDQDNFYNAKFEPVAGKGETVSGADVTLKASVSDYLKITTDRVDFSPQNYSVESATKKTAIAKKFMDATMDGELNKNLVNQLADGGKSFSGSYKEMYAYSKLYKYEPKANYLTVHYFRKHQEELSYVPAGESVEKIVTKTLSTDKQVKVVMVCKTALDYRTVTAWNTAELAAPKAPQGCTITDVKRLSKKTKADIKQGSMKNPEKIAAEKKTKSEKSKAVLAAFRGQSDERKQAEAIKAIGNLSESGWVSDDAGLMTASDALDATNSQAKLYKNLNQFNQLVKKDAVISVASYPGSMAAGVSDGRGNRGCDELCMKLSTENSAADKIWNDNFAFAKKSARFNGSASQAHPALWSEVHGFTHNPFPWPYVSLALFLAMFCNAGQQWLSAYISKVLSSLWKNICAAVSLAVVIWVEKLVFSSHKEFAAVDFSKLAFATCGVMLTVFVFQLAPKPPKEEKPVAKDVENQLPGGPKK